MTEIAILTPLESEEIIEIIVQECRKRLRSLSPLQLGKEYAGFSVDYSHTIKLVRMGTNGGGTKDTLAWGNVQAGTQSGEAETVEDKSKYVSDINDVNGEREKHDLPLTVEVSDGKGGKQKKKVRVKG